MGIIFTVSWAAAFAVSLLARYEGSGIEPYACLLSGAVLLAAAIVIYIKAVKKSGSAVDLLALFSLSYIGGMGISCFKLSYLQTDWETMTWVCLFFAYTGFYVCYTYFADKLRIKKTRKKAEKVKSPEIGAEEIKIGNYENRVMTSAVGLTLISAAAFLLEAVKLGYVPLFTVGVPHAYSYFHVSGVHYFTVSCVLVPSLLLIYLLSIKKKGGKLGRKLCLKVGVLAAASLLIPVLCVSRFQLIFAVMLAISTGFVMLRPSFSATAKIFALAVVVMLPLYIFLTYERAHSVEYLNGIFEMRNEATPIFITQPYMYIANNYDNFNCLVRDLPEHSYGLKMLFPVWALTGLKFSVPSLVDFPLYVTKTELTTLTLFYDAYYDFGAIGVLLFSGALGTAARKLSDFTGKGKERNSNPVKYLFYAQFASYMALSFFTTWFSNPATWFYFAVSLIIFIYTGGYFEKLLKMRS